MKDHMIRCLGNRQSPSSSFQNRAVGRVPPPGGSVGASASEIVEILEIEDDSWAGASGGNTLSSCDDEHS